MEIEGEACIDNIIMVSEVVYGKEEEEATTRTSAEEEPVAVATTIVASKMVVKDGKAMDEVAGSKNQKRCCSTRRARVIGGVVAAILIIAAVAVTLAVVFTNKKEMNELDSDAPIPRPLPAPAPAPSPVRSPTSCPPQRGGSHLVECINLSRGYSWFNACDSWDDCLDCCNNGYECHAGVVTSTPNGHIPYLVTYSGCEKAGDCCDGSLCSADRRCTGIS